MDLKDEDEKQHAFLARLLSLVAWEKCSLRMLLEVVSAVGRVSEEERKEREDINGLEG